MTRNEIKSELNWQKVAAGSSLEEADYSSAGIREQSFSEAITLLNQLSAPPLKWVQVNPNNWEAATPTGKYQVSLSEGDWNCIHEHDLFVRLRFLSEEIAKSVAETHWDKLYRQIINL